jgi:hypothetical protein
MRRLANSQCGLQYALSLKGEQHNHILGSTKRDFEFLRVKIFCNTSTILKLLTASMTAMMMKAVQTADTSVFFYRATWRYNKEGCSLHTCISTVLICNPGNGTFDAINPFMSRFSGLD